METFNVKIYNHDYKIRIIPRDFMPNKNAYGFTWSNEQVIEIREGLTRTSFENTVRHEVVHAILDSQGRQFENKFDLEDLCEFVSRNLDEINNVVENVLEHYKEKE